MDSVFRLFTLGGYRMLCNSVELPVPRTTTARALLAYLIMHAGHDIARERLIEIFWAERDTEQARGSLKTALWLIRTTLRVIPEPLDELLYTNKTIVRWKNPTWFDVSCFFQYASRGDIESLRSAHALYKGDFLEGDFGGWASGQQARIANTFETVLWQLLNLSRDGRIAEELLERNPYSEAAYRTLIEERLESGRIAAAREIVERCVAALAEVGASPSEEFMKRFGTFVTAHDRARADTGAVIDMAVGISRTARRDKVASRR